MAILRVVALKDASGTAMTSCGQGTVYDVGGIQPGKRVYAALQILSSSTGALKVRVLSNSSSGYTGGNPGTVQFNFTCTAARAAEWLTPLTTATITSTDRKFWRTIWEMTTSGESYKFVPVMGIQ